MPQPVKLVALLAGVGLSLGAGSVPRLDDPSSVVIRNPAPRTRPKRPVAPSPPLTIVERKSILLNAGSKSARAVGRWHFGAPPVQSVGTQLLGYGLTVDFSANTIELGDSPTSMLEVGHDVVEGQFFVIDFAVQGGKVKIGDEYHQTVMSPKHGHVVATVYPNNGGGWSVYLLPMPGGRPVVTGINITDYTK